ncbi:MAG: winged helix-turn-helix domain-containing protein [Sphaerochaetaceae bacterium]|jgi:molybdate transport system regulatory protein
MEILTKLYLVDSSGEKFMGIGVLWLLQELGKENSLRQAALNLGISYSKAYRMVKQLEMQVGFDVINRQKGGSNHKGSTLTEFGKKFIILYDKFQLEAKERLEEPFKKFMVEFEKLEKKF